MTKPAYAIARPAARRILEQLATVRSGVDSSTLSEPLAPQPDVETIEAMIDAAFWASLREEEGLPPKISLAFLPPHGSQVRLTFERSLRLAPEPLTRLAPAVENPGIHLGVWREGEELRVWGATIGRRHTSAPVERVLLSEPVEGDVARLLAISELGGTRHQSAAQFVHDQRDAVALVASKDGLFSLFSWSAEREMVHVHRVEGLLL